MTALGLRARKGGAVVIGITMDKGEPRVVVSTLLETCADGDRLSFEPYRVAAEMARGPQGGVSAEAAEVVAEGRRRQERLATNSLRGTIRQLEGAGCKPVVAALLVNRASWITDLLQYSLAWPEHVPVAEALAVRDALRFACHQCGIEIAEMDEKSLPDFATRSLGMPSTEITARLKALGAPIGKPWRKEQKLACLSAWTAVTGQR
ncbi:hypothetical protein [Dyella humicola]|uniref:hypothetical protein n=1 Tax=Dyella humicola TaxID=2992126 RepID=UPI0022589A79|nr:hypothetical protein [Dyella humicola]